MVGSELLLHGLEQEQPLLFKHVVLLELRAHVALVLFVVRAHLGLALLEHLHFKATLARPLLPQVLVQFFH